MQESWLIWALIGVACIGLEMLMPGFVIFFFGLGALATALACLIPPVGDNTWLQILVFSAASVVSLVFLRKRFSRVFEGTVFIPGKADPEESGVGQYCDVVETLSGDKNGRVRFRGTTWTARSTGATIPAGARSRIVRLEGMTYIVESISSKEEV